MVTISYFAWVREVMGRAEDLVEFPESVTDVASLLDWLATRDDLGAQAFHDSKRICVALDGVMVAKDAPITGAQDISLFPPVSGG